MKYALIAAAAGFLLRPPGDGPPPGKKGEGPPPTDPPPPNETAGNETEGMYGGNETFDDGPAMSGNESTEDKIEDHQDHLEDKFADGNCSCDPDVVETCKGLWEAKEAECEEHKEEWAGMCSAPQYTDPNTGELRDCQKGCCSEAGQETGMEQAVEGEEPEPARIWSDCSKDGEIGVAEAEDCIAKELPPFLSCLAEPLADCMTSSYGDGDGVITKEEFFAEFGQHMDNCFEKSIRKEDGTMALPCPGFEDDLAAHMAGEGSKLFLHQKKAVVKKAVVRKVQ